MTKKTILISIICVLFIGIAGFSVWKFVLNNPESTNTQSNVKQISQNQPKQVNQVQTPTPDKLSDPKVMGINDDDREVDSILKEILQEEPSADPASN